MPPIHIPATTGRAVTLRAGQTLRIISVEGKQVADFELMQMFPWFGTLKYAKDEMSLMAKASYESLKDARLQLFYEVQIVGTICTGHIANWRLQAIISIC